MTRARWRRCVAALAVTALAVGASLVACSSDDAASGSDAGGDDASNADASGSDGSSADGGSGTDGGHADGATDAGPRDAALHDAMASGDAQTGDPCVFNRECVAADRCACDEDSGLCACQPGARGTGQNGVTACDSGDQCASSLCIEGTAGAFYCTDECVNPSDCKPNLPRCVDIDFIGRICVRDPDAG